MDSSQGADELGAERYAERLRSRLKAWDASGELFTPEISPISDLVEAQGVKPQGLRSLGDPEEEEPSELYYRAVLESE